MSLKQCPGCEAMVDASKAYCPDCGASMDEEIHRTDSSEFDSLMRTQNINKTTQLRMLEEFNLSSMFKLPDETSESKAVEGETKPFPILTNERQETQYIPKKTETIILKPQIENPASTKKPEAVSNSNKKLFVAISAGIIFVGLIFIGVIVLGILFYYFSK